MQAYLVADSRERLQLTCHAHAKGHAQRHWTTCRLYKTGVQAEFWLEINKYGGVLAITLCFKVDSG